MARAKNYKICAKKKNQADCDGPCTWVAKGVMRKGRETKVAGCRVKVKGGKQYNRTKSKTCGSIKEQPKCTKTANCTWVTKGTMRRGREAKVTACRVKVKGRKKAKNPYGKRGDCSKKSVGNNGDSECAKAPGCVLRWYKPPKGDKRRVCRKKYSKKGMTSATKSGATRHRPAGHTRGRKPKKKKKKKKSSSSSSSSVALRRSTRLAKK